VETLEARAAALQAELKAAQRGAAAAAAEARGRSEGLEARVATLEGWLRGVEAGARPALPAAGTGGAVFSVYTIKPSVGFLANAFRHTVDDSQGRDVRGEYACAAPGASVIACSAPGCRLPHAARA